MSTKTATKASTKATAKASTETQRKQAQTAMKAAALDLSTDALVKRLTTIRTSNDTTAVQVEEFRNMFEAAKLQASNQRVLLARNAYLLASHKDVATKRYPVFAGGAAKLMAGPNAEAKQIDALRKWLTAHIAAGTALEAKKLVWNSGDPTEAERAIVEAAHDAGIRAESAKKNGKVREAAAKGKAADKGTETDEDGVEKSKAEVAIPTAEGMLAALETTLQNFRKFNAEARLTKAQVSAAEDLLTAIMGELAPETALEVNAEDA